MLCYVRWFFESFINLCVNYFFFFRGMFKFLDEDFLVKLMFLIINIMGKLELKFGLLENLNLLI